MILPGGHPSGLEDMKNKTKGIIAMLGASVCFATGGVLIKMIPWNPLAINGTRNLIAASVIGLYMFLRRHRIKCNPTVLAGAVSMAGVTTFFTIANKLTSAGSAIVLQYTAPVWLVLFMLILFRKKPKRYEVYSVLIVFAGICCFFLESLSSGKILGDFVALLSGIFYAGVFMLNQFEEGDALSSMLLGQLLCGITMSPFALRETEFGAPVILAILMLGIVQVGIAYILFSIGTAYTDPVTASVVNAVEPILNPVLVAAFYGEKLGNVSLIGAVIVIAGVLFYNIRNRQAA